MKEKTYKTARDACKHQQSGEAAVYDKAKRKYVNIKDFPPYKDPFKKFNWRNLIDYAALGYCIITSMVGAIYLLGYPIGFILYFLSVMYIVHETTRF